MKTLRFLTVLAMLLPVCAPAYPDTFLFRFSLDQIALQAPTPHDLGKFLKDHFKFVEDEKQFGQADYWQTPEEFLQTQAGDCEDFALLSQQILQRLGKQAFVLNIYGRSGYAHTVTVFKDEAGLYNVVNEDRFLEYRAGSIEEAISQIHSEWTWAAIAELRNSRGWMLRKITRP